MSKIYLVGSRSIRWLIGFLITILCGAKPARSTPTLNADKKVKEKSSPVSINPVAHAQVAIGASSEVMLVIPRWHGSFTNIRTRGPWLSYMKRYLHWSRWVRFVSLVAPTSTEGANACSNGDVQDGSNLWSNVGV